MKNEKTSPRIASIAAKMMARLIGTPKSRHGEDVIFWNGEEWICIGTVKAG